MQNGKTSPAITTITPAANDKIQNEISRGGRKAENKANAWEKAQTAKIRKRYTFAAFFLILLRLMILKPHITHFLNLLLQDIL